MGATQKVSTKNLTTPATFGRVVLGLPWRTAFQIFDSKVRRLLRSEFNRGPFVSAESIEALGRKSPASAQLPRAGHEQWLTLRRF